MAQVVIHIAVGEGRRESAVQAIGEVGGSDRRAVRESQPFADMEGVGLLVLAEGPGIRAVGGDMELVVEPHQSAKYQRDHKDGAGSQILGRRVEIGAGEILDTLVGHGQDLRSATVQARSRDVPGKRKHQEQCDEKERR